MATRQKFLTLHKWIGLIAAVGILLQAITGTILVYRAELPQLLDPAGFTRETDSGQQSISAIVETLENRYPEFSVERIFFPESPGHTYFIAMANASGSERFASVDPGNGEILRSGPVWRFPVELALRLHYQALPGKVGILWVVLIGLSVLAMVATGIYCAWPARNSGWKSLLSVNWRLPARLKFRQIHRSVGLIAAPVALVIVITGITIALEILLANGGSPAGKPAATEAAPIAGIDKGIEIAGRQFPENRIRDVRLVDESTLKVLFRAPEFHSQAVHQVLIDRADLDNLSVLPARENDALWMMLYPFHTGTFFGSAGRVLVLLGGVTLLVLTGLGLLIWFLRVRTRSRK